MQTINYFLYSIAYSLRQIQKTFLDKLESNFKFIRLCKQKTVFLFGSTKTSKRIDNCCELYNDMRHGAWTDSACPSEFIIGRFKRRAITINK